MPGSDRPALPTRETLRRPPITSAQRGLELLSHGLNRDIIRELVERGPSSRAALIARLHASSTKLYECLKALRAAEVVEIRRRRRVPEYAITASGRRLQEGMAVVLRWFDEHPQGRLDPSVGWRAFADLATLWRLGIVEWIVRCAPGVAELADGFGGLDEQHLKETFDGMILAGALELRKGHDRRRRYRLTPWAAQAITVFAFIARWEHDFEPSGSTPIVVDDAVVAILATLPLVRVPDHHTGIFTLAAEVEPDDEAERRVAMVWARVQRGRVTDVGEGAPPEPPVGWVTGTFSDWLSSGLDGQVTALRFDGTGEAGAELVVAIVVEGHRQLVS